MQKQTTKNKPKSNWHSIEKDFLLRELSTSNDGLQANEVQKRRLVYGENKLPKAKRVTILQIIGHQVLNPLIFILLAAAIASIAIGEGKDAIFILLVILINSALGTYQEYNAEKSASSLQNLMKIKAKVKRDGKIIILNAEDVTIGDIVYLESGLKVPADLRLIDATNLELDESFLTGESIAAKKHTQTIPEATIVAERANMAFAGATVMKGRGIGVVVSIGKETEVGRISQNVTLSVSEKPPLVQRMEHFINQISIFIIALSVILAVVLRLQGMDFAPIFFFVVALSVSAIPEGLPVALTVALSIATKRMAKRNVIVRKLTSVESLGSCTVIASDKTGTLTVNEQTAQIIQLPNRMPFEISGEGYNGIGEVADFEGKEINYKNNSDISRLVRTMALANEANLSYDNQVWSHQGDAMDVALLGLCIKLGELPNNVVNEFPIIDKIPYESEQKFSAAFCNANGSVFVEAKGAVETILDFCSKMSVNGEEIAIDKKSIIADADALARKGYRVLAFGSGGFNAPLPKENNGNYTITNLTFFGLIGFIDPLRAGAKDSVLQCKSAGIKVIMITGDHPETAATIAQQLSIINENAPVVTGQMLSDTGKSDNPKFEKLVLSSCVFARVSPTQKLEIVDVLIRNGEFVAVTGDGVNDAPALKRANIGVAMGSGTDVAKEVGAMIIVDDNFSSIVAGVEEGRFAYDNVRKVIYLLISTGAAEIILFLASIFAGLPLPLLAVQLLWLNLVTNGIQDVALAFEKGEPGAMKRPPRKPSENIFNPLMISQTAVSGGSIGLIVFILWYYLINYIKMDELHARDLVLLLMVFMQNFHTFNARSERQSAFKIPFSNNYLLVIGVLAAQGIHVISMQIPFMQKVLRIEPISVLEWCYVLILAIPILLVMELFKLIRNRQEDKKKKQEFV